MPQAYTMQINATRVMRVMRQYIVKEHSLALLAYFVRKFLSLVGGQSKPRAQAARNRFNGLRVNQTRRWHRTLNRIVCRYNSASAGHCLAYRFIKTAGRCQIYIDSMRIVNRRGLVVAYCRMERNPFERGKIRL